MLCLESESPDSKEMSFHEGVCRNFLFLFFFLVTNFFLLHTKHVVRKKISVISIIFLYTFQLPDA